MVTGVVTGVCVSTTALRQRTPLQTHSIKLIAACVLAASLALPQYTCEVRSPQGNEPAEGARVRTERHYALENFQPGEPADWLILAAFVWPLLVVLLRSRGQRLLRWLEPLLLAGSGWLIYGRSGVGRRAIGAYLAFTALALYGVAWLLELRRRSARSTGY